MAKVTVGTRVDPEAIQQLDQIAAELTSRAKGAEVTRSDAARIALERGIDVLKVELGLAPALASEPSAKGIKAARKPRA